MVVDGARLRVRIVTAFLLLAVFAAGVFAGVRIDRLIGSKIGGPPPGFGGPLPVPLDRLNLTPEQHRKVHQILERHRPAFDEIFSATFPRVRQIQQKLDAEVLLVLTAEQQAVFRRLAAEGSKRSGPPRPGPMPPRGARGAGGPPPPDPFDAPPLDTPCSDERRAEDAPMSESSAFPR